MDKESIIKEWFYRLPKGYATLPYTSEEMDILHIILEENDTNGSVFVNEVDQLDQEFHDAKPVDESEEDTGPLVDHDPLKPLVDIGINLNFASKIFTQKKIDDFLSFYAGIPSPAAKSDLIEVLNNITPSSRDQFLKELASIDSISDLKKQNPLSESSLDKMLFKLRPDGTGPGEVWLAWKIKGVKISGAGLSYDINIISDQMQGKYEVKAYNTPTLTEKPFRLGTHGTLSKFKFYNNFIKTANLIKRITAVESIKEHFVELANEFESLRKIDFQSKLATGEVSQARLNALLDFYDAANTYIKKYKSPEKYDMLQIKSSMLGSPSKYFSIKPMSIPDVLKGNFEVLNEIPKDGIQRIMQEMNSDKYIRNPETIMNDVNDAIQSVSDSYYKGLGAGFLVFRLDGTSIAPKAELKKVTDIRTAMGKSGGNIYKMSMGKLYVKENI